MEQPSDNKETSGNPALSDYQIHLIVPLGTQVVTREEIPRVVGTARPCPRGAVG